MSIRDICVSDRAAWSRMRTTLWPDTDDQHMGEIPSFFDGRSHQVQQVFVAQHGDGNVVGFIEINIRNSVEGSTQTQLPYVEGWDVDASHRREGWGRQLIQAAENWAYDTGYTELGSDTE